MHNVAISVVQNPFREIRFASNCAQTECKSNKPKIATQRKDFQLNKYNTKWFGNEWKRFVRNKNIHLTNAFIPDENEINAIKSSKMKASLKKHLVKRLWLKTQFG